MSINTLISGPCILTINAGSSSIKFSLFTVPQENQVIVGQIDGIGAKNAIFEVRWAGAGDKEVLSWSNDDEPKNHREALSFLITWINNRFNNIDIVAIGHRVVHGGQKYLAPTLINEEIMHELESLMALAPLHEPHNLAGIRAAQENFPSVPQVACFDTAFHRTHSFVDDCYAIPRSFYNAGVCRYGFHGLSYEYITERLVGMFPKESRGRVIIAHLGNGASMKNCISVASTMGFSSLDGLPMGTRCGEIDPGVLLYMMQHDGLNADQIANILYKESGLKGLSGGLSNDMRTLEASDKPEAKEAIEYYVKEVKREIGALAALLGGLDVLVFTGGIGENSAMIRARVLKEMSWIGIDLDEDSNLAGETIISSDNSNVLCLKMHTDEERIIARHTYELSKNQELVVS
jgi:acetate kinase